MRKLSCKWPLWLTLIAFSSPIFYIFHRIGKPGIFNATELATKVFVAFVFMIIFWLIYGVSCIFAKPKELSEDLHGKIHRDEGTVFKSVRPSGVLRKKKVKK